MYFIKKNRLWILSTSKYFLVGTDAKKLGTSTVYFQVLIRNGFRFLTLKIW